MFRRRGGGGLSCLTRTALVAVALLGAAALLVMDGGRPAEAHHLCPSTGSPFGPFSIVTYEAENYKTLYGQTMELVAFNQLFPEVDGFGLPKIETGERSAGSTETLDGYIPPTILKAIAFNESGWAQASYSPLVDYGEVGPVLSSHDCGYGLMQVTTGMQNISGVPNIDQAMIGTHYAFNISRGARILVDKWNMSPEYRPMIGDRDPKTIENWYFAIWGYNGWAFQNHPLNPAYSPGRAPFSCGPSGDGFGHDRSQYPYQELIMGCVARPPVKGGTQLWDAQEVHLPELDNPLFSGPLNVENWNACAYSSQCTTMDIPTPNTFHQDPTTISLSREEVIGAPKMAVSTDSVNLAIATGMTTTQTGVTVSNPGTGLLGFRAVSSASWAKVSPAAAVALGTDLGGKTSMITITVTTVSLPPGVSTTQVRVESLYGGTKTIAVSVTVPAPTPAEDPRQGPRLTGDFNGDGRTDIIFQCCSDTSLVWLARADAGFDVSTFRPWAGYALRSGSWQTGDVNGDGRTDLLHLCCSDVSVVWLSNGNGTFNVYPYSVSEGYPYLSGSWEAGDFNGDGRDDFVHLCCGSTTRTWLANGDGTFQVADFTPWDGYGMDAGSWETGDINGDGKTDLLHLCCSDYMQTWTSRGDGSFDVGWAQAWPDYTMQAGRWLAADVTGDGRTDLVHLCCRDYAHTWTARAGGGFQVSTSTAWPDYGIQTGTWEVSDMNGDGRDDLLHRCCSDYVHMWYSMGGGKFNVKGYQPWPQYGIAAGYWEGGDFDGDGKGDFLHLCCSYANLWLARDATFEIRVFQP